MSSGPIWPNKWRVNSSDKPSLFIWGCFWPSVFHITTHSLFLYLKVGGGKSCPNSTAGLSPVLSLLGDGATWPSFEGFTRLESTSLRVIVSYSHEGFRKQDLLYWFLSVLTFSMTDEVSNLKAFSLTLLSTLFLLHFHKIQTYHQNSQDYID